MQRQSAHSNNAVNYYTILDIPTSPEGSAVSISKDELKAAYHRALLRNHPDKVSRPHREQSIPSTLVTAKESYNIDEIVQAYQTLSSTKLKREYDIQLRWNNEQSRAQEHKTSLNGTHLGVEVYDLEDLQHDDVGGKWSKSCRCGHEEGYTITETELEKECNEGEIYVGCRGCSLFIRVVFGLVEEDAIVQP